ncbi:hypothetical protein FRB93_011413, partial [Tulasnella sp. JGI-2019a]
AEATGPTFFSILDHLIYNLLSILLATGGVDICITSTTLEYAATAGTNKEDEEDEEFSQCIHIQASGDQFTEGFILETLSWLLDNLYTPSISLPISLNICGITSSHAITHIIDLLPSVITNLNLNLIGASSAQTILYLTEPFQVIIDGTPKLQWLLPKLMDPSFEMCDDLEPEIILGCIQHHAGCGPFWAGWSEHHEELLARLTRLILPYGSSTKGLMQMFPNYMEWSRLEQEDGLSDRD